MDVIDGCCLPFDQHACTVVEGSELTITSGVKKKKKHHVGVKGICDVTNKQVKYNDGLG